jgi:hypothetical protein
MNNKFDHGELDQIRTQGKPAETAPTQFQPAHMINIFIWTDSRHIAIYSIFHIFLLFLYGSI